MSKDNNLHDFLQDVADAIKEKKGSNDAINAQNFSDEIKNLPSGGDDGLAMSLLQRTITEYSNEEITEFGPFAFAGCSKLVRVYVPSLKYVSMLMFQESGLIEIELPNIYNIASQGFQGATSLKKVTLGEGLYANVANMAFYNCTSFDTLILLPNTFKTLGSATLAGTKIAKGEGYIYVKDELVEEYKSATNWATYADQIKPLSELPQE